MYVTTYFGSKSVQTENESEIFFGKMQNPQEITAGLCVIVSPLVYFASLFLFKCGRWKYNSHVLKTKLIELFSLSKFHPLFCPRLLFSVKAARVSRAANNDNKTVRFTQLHCKFNLVRKTNHSSSNETTNFIWSFMKSLTVLPSLLDN